MPLELRSAAKLVTVPAESSFASARESNDEIVRGPTAMPSAAVVPTASTSPPPKAVTVDSALTDAKLTGSLTSPDFPEPVDMVGVLDASSSYPGVASVSLDFPGEPECTCAG